MKIYMFDIFMTYKGEEIEEDLLGFFQKICNIPRENRLRKTYYEYPVLLKSQKEYGDLKNGFSLYKYRKDSKPYIENSANELKIIEEDVIEVTNFILDHHSNTICMQYNRESLNEASVEKYLNSFIKTRGFKIEIKKIYENFELREVLNSDRIKAITPIISPEVLTSVSPTPFLGSICAALSNEEETKISLQIENKEWGGKLSGETVETVANMFFEQEELQEGIEDVLVTYKDNNGDKVTKSIKELKRPIGKEILENETNIGWEYILDTVHDNFENLNGLALLGSRVRSRENLVELERGYEIKVIPSTYYSVTN